MWYPKADRKTQDFSKKYSGSAIKSTRVLLHSTETRGWPGYGGGSSAPHMTIMPDFKNKKVLVRQHFPANRNSRALRNLSGGVQTNLLDVFQIEMIGTCDGPTRDKWKKAGHTDFIFMPEAPDWYIKGVADVLVWLKTVYPEFEIKDGAPRGWGKYPSSYGNAKYRMTNSEWSKFKGVVGHQHAPENSHGDPSNFPIDRLISLAKGSTTPVTPTPEPDKKTTAKTRYEVTTNGLNGRSGPGMSYPVKVVRDKGFQFNSTVQSGDWVRASVYWYHKDYLKVAPNKTNPKPAEPVVPAGDLLLYGSRGAEVKSLQEFMGWMFPTYKNHVAVQRGQALLVDGIYGGQMAAWVREFQKRTGLDDDGIVGHNTRVKLFDYGWKGQKDPVPNRVNIRVGSLNIPLDSAKLPNGKSRSKSAAKRVNSSNLAVLAVQELDRGSNAKKHDYAEMFLKDLGKDWKMVKPTTAWNENYIFYRPSVITFKYQSGDIIIPSSKGGRHATRAEFEKNGKNIRIMSTHFVSGSANGKAREEQGKHLAGFMNSNTIVMGDLNQKDFPAAMEKTHKTARDQKTDSTTNKWGSYRKWGQTTASKAATAFLDHIGVPDKALVKGFNQVGINGVTGALDSPRDSDHLLQIASIDL